MNVIVVDNNNANLESAKKAIKGNVETVEMDVGKIEDFEKLKVGGLSGFLLLLMCLRQCLRWLVRHVQEHMTDFK